MVKKEKPDPKKFCEAFERHLKLYKGTQTAFAEEVGISPATISLLKNGSHLPNPVTRVEMARVLGAEFASEVMDYLPINSFMQIKWLSDDVGHVNLSRILTKKTINKINMLVLSDEIKT